MKLLFAALAALLVSVPVSAETTAPDAMIRQLCDDVIVSIKQDSAIRAGDWSHIAALVETKIVPYFDFGRTTQIAMGRAWREATPQQREELTRQFKQLLIRTYAGALSNYSDQRIEVRPLRAKPQDDEVTVKSVIRQPGAEAIDIDYDLERGADGWKIFDVRVAGVSLVATYRTSFAEAVRNRGVQGLIELLAAKNRERARTG
jgi:phospholipid transport system substrate-binding protein